MNINVCKGHALSKDKGFPLHSKSSFMLAPCHRHEPVLSWCRKNHHNSLRQQTIPDLHGKCEIHCRHMSGENLDARSSQTHWICQNDATATWLLPVALLGNRVGHFLRSMLWVLQHWAGDDHSRRQSFWVALVWQSLRRSLPSVGLLYQTFAMMVVYIIQWYHQQ